MAYYGIALHTPEFGSNVYMVFFLGALSELPMTVISKFSIWQSLCEQFLIAAGICGRYSYPSSKTKYLTVLPSFFFLPSLKFTFLH
jgi:hypothetical protein